MNGENRKVDVPDAVLNGNPDNDLEKIFYYGQNDFQPVKNNCSVSTGDFIEYKNKLYLVMGVGFKKVSQKQMDDFMKLDSNERHKFSSFNLLDSRKFH